EDVLEIDLREISRRPLRHRFLEEDVERAQPELEHPVWFFLVRGDLLDDVAIESTPRFERVLLGIAETVLVVLGKILSLDGHNYQAASSESSMPRRRRMGS